ncbi:glycoside hydrolase family 97 N-terminal domain-containing protein [Edaphobacter paludis]
MAAGATAAFWPGPLVAAVGEQPAVSNPVHDAFAAAKPGSMSLPFALTSPSGNVVLTISLTKGNVTYTVSLIGREVILASSLGLKLDGAPPLDSHFKLTKTSQTEHRGSWKPPYGERDNFPDNFNATEIEVQEEIPPGRRLRIEFRAYDEGIAFRYFVPAQPGLQSMVITDERSEFRLADGAYGWWTHTAQGNYTRSLIADVPGVNERPFLIELSNGLWAAIGEAAQDDYPSMFLASLNSEHHSLVGKLMGTADHHAPFSSPWRFILVAEKPRHLLEHNYLLQNLCPPSRLASTNWILPGKVMREMTLSTRGGRELVDFAASQNIQYIEFDAGWYGDQDDEAADATKINVAPQAINANPDYRGLNLREVIDYARSKNIGTILYINHIAMERQLDVLLPLYRQWGVAGIKYGFVNVHTQPWTRLLYDAIKKAGEYRLFLDIHDEFRPTGMSRTYPHLLTQEGIRGNEEFPSAAHSTTLPFTRMLAGAADYTYCWFDPRLKNTWAHQMALAVVLYSPLQFIYWYDHPTAFRTESTGMEWFRELPTVWDDTKVLDGHPGDFVAIARRKGKSWFLGVITNDSGRDMKIDLDMLQPGQQYAGMIFSDGSGPKDIQKNQRSFQHGDVLKLTLQPRGGAAICFTQA